MKMKCLRSQCNNVFSISRKESLRASRPKCPACGNGQLEEVVKPPKEEVESEELQEAQAVA
jgi:uncharacterized protein with PIN domain